MTKRISIALLGAALAVGCGKQVNTSERAQPIGTKTTVQDKRIINDGDADQIFKIIDINEGTVGDLLKVQVNIQNTRGITQSANWMVEWFDMNGMQVQTPTSRWTSLTLEGKQTKSIQAIAPNSRAKDFRFHYQEMKK
jgi:uncharacterized protein YcfL